MWLPVKGYETTYEVSDSGQVRSLGGRRGTAGKLLKQQDLKGYLKVDLCTKGKKHTGLVHRLMATAFLPNPNGLPFINHKNGIKDDNRLENLEWCDHLGNMTHAYNTGLINNTGSNHGNSKLTEGEVANIKHLRGELKAEALASIYGVRPRTVWDIWSGKYWRHVV